MLLEAQYSDATLVAVDVEGNGGQPQKLVEVAIVRIVAGEVQPPPRVWLIHPRKPVSRHTQRIHGISNNDLEGAPEISQVADEILGALGSHPVVGHQVAVDCNLLVQSMPTWTPLIAFDTLKLAKAVMPALRRYSLEALISSLNLGGRLEGRPHRAGHDALAAAYLFVALTQIADPIGKLTLATHHSQRYTLLFKTMLDSAVALGPKRDPDLIFRALVDEKINEALVEANVKHLLLERDQTEAAVHTVLRAVGVAVAAPG